MLYGYGYMLESNIDFKKEYIIIFLDKFYNFLDFQKFLEIMYSNVKIY